MKPRLISTLSDHVTKLVKPFFHYPRQDRTNIFYYCPVNVHLPLDSKNRNFFSFI